MSESRFKELREQVGLTQIKIGAVTNGLSEQGGLTQIKIGVVTNVEPLYAQVENEAHSVKRLKNIRNWMRKYFNKILQRRKNYEDSREIL